MYRFTRVIYGYRNGAEYLMAALQNIMGVDLADKLIIYNDDILIPGLDLDEHLRLLDKVLAKFEATGMRLNLRKCAFL